MDDTALIALSTGCPHLTILDARDEFVTGIGILAVAQNRALVTLQLEECTRMTDSGLKTVAAYSPLLEVVSVMYCFQLTDIALIAIGQHCPNLRVLVVDYMSITDQGIAAIAAGCPLLEELSLSDCPRTGPALAVIARSCPRLRRFNASHSKAPPDAVLALARYCPLLEHFDIRGSNQVGDEEIKALARGCPALKTLDIIGASVTERGLQAVRKYCRNLQKIELTTRSCPGWTLDKRFFPPEVCVEVNTVIVLPCGRVLVPRS
jgi:F-box/leucine-rich repeat protein 2/20